MFEIRKITETLAIGLLDLDVFSRQQALATKREIEKAGTGFLLKSLLGLQKVELQYTEQNKPYLADGKAYISISHSHNKLAIIANNKKETGIDIEMIRDKVIRVRHKFLNEKEALFAQQDITKLISIWAAKEAMYKAHGLKGIDFKLHLSVEINGNDMYGKLEKEGLKKEYRLVREIMDGYILVYILDEIPNAG